MRTNLSTSRRAAQGSSIERHACRTVVVLLGLWAAATLGPAPGHAQQTVPIDLDLLRLDELETPIDDLIRLATSYADALREDKTARLNLKTLQTLQQVSPTITTLEIQIADINVQAANNKVTVLLAIIDKQLAAAMAKVEVLKRLESVSVEGQPRADSAPGGAMRLRVAQAEATVKILQMIRNMK